LLVNLSEQTKDESAQKSSLWIIGDDIPLEALSSVIWQTYIFYSTKLEQPLLTFPCSLVADLPCVQRGSLFFKKSKDNRQITYGSNKKQLLK